MNLNTISLLGRQGQQTKTVHMAIAIAKVLMYPGGDALRLYVLAPFWDGSCGQSYNCRARL